MKHRNPTPTQLGIAAVLVIIIAIVALALTGPAVGNIFSNTVHALNQESTDGYYGGVPAGSAGENDALVNSPAQPRSGQDGQSAAIDRVILRTASLSLTVSDPAAKLTDIGHMADAMGGWVVTSNISHYTDSAGNDTAQGTITVRVPANRLDEALAQIKAGAGEVSNESVNGQDVTADYVDLSSRLTNLQAAETQLQEIMTRATKIDDVLAVQNQLTTIRGNIESLQGQIRYYDESSTYSSITVQVYPVAPGVVETQSAGWNPAKTAESALGVLVAIGQFLVDAAISLAIVGGPLILVLGVPAWIVWRRRRNISAASAA